jgi:hypothetical protein
MLNVKSNYILLTSIVWLVKYNSLLINLNTVYLYFRHFIKYQTTLGILWNFLETYYMQRYVQVMFQNFMLLEWGIDFGLVTPPVSEQEAQRGQTWCSHIL